jgi:hypothetical protein
MPEVVRRRLTPSRHDHVMDAVIEPAGYQAMSRLDGSGSGMQPFARSTSPRDRL